MLSFLGLCDQEWRTIKSMEQKEFYGSLESRKLTFFSVQLDEGLFGRILDHSGKWTSLYHFSEMQSVAIVPPGIWTRSPHRWLLQLLEEEHTSSYDFSWKTLCVCVCVFFFFKITKTMYYYVCIKCWFLTNVNWEYMNRLGWNFTRRAFSLSFLHISCVRPTDKTYKHHLLYVSEVSVQPEDTSDLESCAEMLCVWLFHMWQPVSRARAIL